MTNEELKRELESRFPWLGTQQDADGALTCDELVAWYLELGGTFEEEAE